MSPSSWSQAVRERGRGDSVRRPWFPFQLTPLCGPPSSLQAGTRDIKVGDKVIVLAEEKEDVSKFTSFTPAAGGDAPKPAAAAAPKPAAAAAAPAPGKAYPSHQVLGMPSLSPTMSQGNIAKWKRKVGESIKPGTVIAEIETDKASIEWESQEEGIIAKLLVADGARLAGLALAFCPAGGPTDSLSLWFPEQVRRTLPLAPR